MDDLVVPGETTNKGVTSLQWTPATCVRWSPCFFSTPSQSSPTHPNRRSQNPRHKSCSCLEGLCGGDRSDLTLN